MLGLLRGSDSQRARRHDTPVDGEPFGKHVSPFHCLAHYRNHHPGEQGTIKAGLASAYVIKRSTSAERGKRGSMVLDLGLFSMRAFFVREARSVSADRSCAREQPSILRDTRSIRQRFYSRAISPKRLTVGLGAAPLRR